MTANSEVKRNRYFFFLHFARQHARQQHAHHAPQAVAGEDADALLRLFSRARNARENWMKKQES